MKFDEMVNNILSEKYDSWDEADVMYVVRDGRLKQKSVQHALKRQASNEGYCDSPEQALRRAGIIKSKFDPKKFVQKVGDKWVPAFPFGKPE
jgi:hypothetical protein